MIAVKDNTKDIIISNIKLLKQLYNNEQNDLDVKLIFKLKSTLKDLFSLYIRTQKQIDINFIHQILFLENSDGTKRINGPIFNVLKNHNFDMKDISFNKVHIKNHSFSGLQNVTINIDEIPEKDISNVTLDGVSVIGSLEGANVEGTNFKGYIGSLKLNPKGTKNKSLKHTILHGVEIIGNEDSFVDVCIEGTKFKDVVGNPKINPQTIKNKSFLFSELNGVELVGNWNEEQKKYDLPSFDGCRLSMADFNGSKGQIIINLHKVSNKTIGAMKATGITFIGDFKGIVTDGVKLVDCYHKERGTEPAKKLILMQ